KHSLEHFADRRRSRDCVLLRRSCFSGVHGGVVPPSFASVATSQYSGWSHRRLSNPTRTDPDFSTGTASPACWLGHRSSAYGIAEAAGNRVAIARRDLAGPLTSGF